MDLLRGLFIMASASYPLSVHKEKNLHLGFCLCPV